VEFGYGASGSQGTAAPRGSSFGSDASHTPSAQKFSISPSGVRKPSSWSIEAGMT
jgi:hypothetical protein